MKLLVSVKDAAEARAALEGGADLIDAKDPTSGALGPVTPPVFAAIHAAVAGRRPVTAALGDAANPDAIEHAASAFTAAGAAFVKVGFAGITELRRIRILLAAAVHGAEAGIVVAVAYADAGIAPPALVEAAAAAGAQGLLVDTVDKQGPGLRALADAGTLAAWTATAHGAGLFVALAGKLTRDDLPTMRDAGADIAGVRGAACDGGRTSQVTAARVRLLRELWGPEGETIELQRSLSN